MAEKVALSFKPVGAHTENNSLASVVTLALPAALADGGQIMLQCFTQNVRFTLDGTTPDADTGFRITAARDPIIVWIDPAASLKLIEEAATAVLQYQWGEL
jgi:hypothetical protein